MQCLARACERVAAAAAKLSSYACAHLCKLPPPPISQDTVAGSGPRKGLRRQQVAGRTLAREISRCKSRARSIRRSSLLRCGESVARLLARAKLIRREEEDFVFGRKSFGRSQVHSRASARLQVDPIRARSPHRLRFVRARERLRSLPHTKPFVCCRVTQANKRAQSWPYNSSTRSDAPGKSGSRPSL